MDPLSDPRFAPVCYQFGCDMRANWGFRGPGPAFCAAHSAPGMVEHFPLADSDEIAAPEPAGAPVAEPAAEPVAEPAAEPAGRN